MGLLLVIVSFAGISFAKDKKAYEKQLEAKVKVVLNPAHVEECELVGLVESKTRAAIWNGYKKNKRAYVRIREKALEMGGNVVLLFESKNSSTTTRLQGEVYLCPIEDEQKPPEEKPTEAVESE